MHRASLTHAFHFQKIIKKKQQTSEIYNFFSYFSIFEKVFKKIFNPQRKSSITLLNSEKFMSIFFYYFFVEICDLLYNSLFSIYFLFLIYSNDRIFWIYFENESLLLWFVWRSHFEQSKSFAMWLVSLLRLFEKVYRFEWHFEMHLLQANASHNGPGKAHFEY